MKAFKIMGMMMVFFLSVTVVSKILGLQPPGVPAGQNPIATYLQFSLNEPATWLGSLAILGALIALARFGGISINLGVGIYAGGFFITTTILSGLLNGLIEAEMLAPVLYHLFYWPIYFVLMVGLIQISSGVMGRR